MKRKMYYFMVAIGAIVLMTQCTRDLVLTPPVTEPEINEAMAWTPDQGIINFLSDDFKENAILEDLEFIDRILKNPKAEELRSRGVETHIPAGSNNALAAAIASAGVDDVIIVDAGDHTETGTVVINKKVKIYGQKGARVIFSNTAAGITNFTPAFYIPSQGAESVIKGLNITGSDPVPGLCIFIDSTTKVKILQNVIDNWLFGILSYKSDRVVVTQNKVAVNAGGGHGIIFADGNHNNIVLNEVYGAVFGIWTGGNAGLSFSNNTHHCLYGQNLCKVPAGALSANDRIINTTGTTVNWKVKYNMSDNNIAAGYLVIDGATGNWLQHNCASGNGTYAFELTGDTYRFGFLTPKSVNNTVIAYRGLTVKDCGENNKVIGGIWINTATDPCN